MPESVFICFAAEDGKYHDFLVGQMRLQDSPNRVRRFLGEGTLG